VRAALLIAANDVRRRLRDRSALLVAFVVPLALAGIFGLTLSDVGSGDVSFRYALVDRDGGEAAGHLREALLGAEREGFVELETAESLAEGRRLVEDGRVAATFVVPPGFSRALEQGGAAELSVLGGLDAQIGTLVARSIALSFTAELDAVRVAVAAAGGRADLAAGAASLPRPVTIDDVSTTRKELDPTTFYAAGMAVFFLFFTVQFGVSSLFDERREGTLARLLAGPIRPGSIVAGKLLTSFVLGMVSMTVLAVATALALGADWGNPLGVALLLAAGVVAATAVMALVATLARTPEQVGSWQAMVALVLGMLGGAFFPVAQAGGPVEALSRLTPHAWFLEGLRELSGGAGASAVLPAVAAILLFAAVAGGAAFLRLGKLVEP
jgi:ABC-2 type transport system permease protein